MCCDISAGFHFSGKMVKCMPMNMLSSIFPSRSERVVKSYRKTVDAVNNLEPEIKALSDIELRARSLALKDKIQSAQADSSEGAKPGQADKAVEAKSLDTYIPEAFALVREASRRTLGQRHYDVQLIGGMVIHSGSIAEMKTGEGKTLMATLAAYLNALSGKGVHIITVNDYLSRRDAVWMGQIYHMLGLSIAVVNADSSFIYDPAHITPDPGQTQEQAEKEVDKAEDETGAFKVQYEYLRPVTRREAYAADITYGTNSEFGFDYLRDNLERTPGGLRQRGFNFVIVDEVDSILIDEARTPLIISAASGDSGSLYVTFAQIVKGMEEEVHFTKNEKYKSIAVTDAGIDYAEQALGISNIYSEGGIKYVHHLENAIRAQAIYKNEIDYIVKEGEILIVDPATGRVKGGHRWSEGLHQAIEAKEGVKIQQESRTQASITFQNYFKLYPKLSGMTGTGQTSSEEFIKVYDVEVISVPTHRPVARADKADLIFKTEAGKFQAVTNRIKELHEKGQPVLVGTVSIEKSQELGILLKKAGVPHLLLNAKPEFAEREGETIAQAGKRGAVTIATNMAGRGVDIKLGGAPSTPESYEEIKNLGGLYVIGTERHEARRIDNQLRGRSGRQGDPGETQFYVSLEDYLMRNFAGNDFVKKMMDKMKIPDDMPIETSMVSRSLENAQTKIEGWYFDSRKQVFEFDNVLNQQRLKVYSDRRKVLIGEEADLETFYNSLVDFGDDEDKEALKTKREEIEKGSGGVSGGASGSASPSTSVSMSAFLSIFRNVMLQAIDTFWIEHLETMDHLRGSVNLRAYGQHDPLVEYKREGHTLFKQMDAAIKAQTLQVLKSLTLEVGKDISFEQQVGDESKLVLSGPQSGVAGLSGLASPLGSGGQVGSLDVRSIDPTLGSDLVKTSTVVSGQDKVGRNDPCPCGSGKKYKKCHGQNA